MSSRLRGLETIRTLIVAISLVAGSSPAFSSPVEVRDAVEGYIARHEMEIVRELWEALSIPAVASDAENIRRKAIFLQERLERRGFSSEILETEGNPLVYGDLRVEGAEKTLLFYAHYDGQPVDGSKWAQEDPFQPVLRAGRLEDAARVLDLADQTGLDDDARIYARCASDDTAPIIALLAALDALAAAGRQPTANIRVLFDGEEEAGSPSLVSAIERYRDRLDADLLLIIDGPLHPSDLPTVVHGARGILTLELTVYGPRVPVHSGHYGNWVPNPAMRLAQLLASMKDGGGRVTVAGFYDGIDLSPADRSVLDSVPDDLEELERALGFTGADTVGESLQEAIQYPSLNVRGLHSAWVGGEARTIVPDQAVAALDLRLVRETPADDLYSKVLAHIRGQGYHVVGDDPTDEERSAYPRIVKLLRSAGSEAYRTPIDHPQALRVHRALADMWGVPPVVKRTSGGTVPIAPFVRLLGLPALGLPTVNYDNNQHSPNENIRIGHLRRSIVTMAAMLMME